MVHFTTAAYEQKEMLLNYSCKQRFENPKVSILVPTYNQENYLREALDSLISQTLKDIEILCINDGSTDSTPQILEEYRFKDRRIKVINKPNSGYGATMNAGLDNATGEYVGIVEPDDYIDSHMYEDLYKIAKEYDSDIVKSCFYDNLQAKEVQRILKTKWNNDKIPQNRSFTAKECGLFLQYHPSIWSCIYKRDFIDKHNIRFVEAPGSGWTDNPFQVQTMCLAERISYTPNAYYYWRRLNSDESDDLKDYTIPFKRTDEIHQWLEINNINNEEILSNLYSRELSYASLVLGKKDLADINDAINLISIMTKNINKDLIFSSENIKKRNKKRFNMIIENPIKYRKAILFQKFKKNLISIRWNKREKRVILFGKTILKGKIEKCYMNYQE